MKLVALTVAAALAAALVVAGCGGSSSSSTGGAAKQATAPNAPAGSKVVSCSAGQQWAEELRATGVDCGTARATMQQWQSSHACALATGASRSSCSLGGLRCQAVRVDRGAEVSCAREGADVSFIKSDPG